MVRSTVAFVLLSAVALILGTAPPAAASVSGSVGDRTNDFVSYTFGGGDLALVAGSTTAYEGTWTGGPITMSGEFVVARPKGVVSYVSMAAGIGDPMQIGDDVSFSWPESGSGEVSGTTVTQPYALSFTVPPSAQERGATIEGGVSLSVCGGVCATTRISFKLRVPKKATTPVVRAVPGTYLTNDGARARLVLSVQDDSGSANVHPALYNGGALVGGGNYAVTADGRLFDWVITVPSGLAGPLFYCVSADNAGGGVSVNAPRSSCTWIKHLVPIARVSNHCGGAGWATIQAIQNYFGNTSKYYEPRNRRTYKVSFVRACDLHDAGYGGHTVRDTINTSKKHPKGAIVDFRSWNRERVDNKFLRDMQRLCLKQIPRAAPNARRDCFNGRRRFNVVRSWGDNFFDADLMTPGTQAVGHRDNT